MVHVITRMPKIPDAGKPSLLFVHGAWHASWCWDEYFLPYFAEKGFPTYALDLRGHGESSIDKQLRFTTIGDYVDDVAEVVDNIDGPVIVVGHSMGGFVVQHFLKDHSVAGAVLLATVPWYGAIVPTLSFMKNHPLRFAKINLTMTLYPFVEDPLIAGALLLADDAASADRGKYLPRLQDESWLGYMQMVFLKLVFRIKSSVPVLVVGGEKDALFSPQSQQSTAAKYDARCHIIEGAPHDIMIDKRWKQSAGIIENWLRDLTD